MKALELLWQILLLPIKRKLHFGQVMQIEITLDDFNKKGCDMFYRMTCKESENIVSIAKTGLVFFDYKTKKPVSEDRRY